MFFWPRREALKKYIQFHHKLKRILYDLFDKQIEDMFDFLEISNIQVSSYYISSFTQQILGFLKMRATIKTESSCIHEIHWPRRSEHLSARNHQMLGLTLQQNSKNNQHGLAQGSDAGYQKCLG